MTTAKKVYSSSVMNSSCPICGGLAEVLGVLGNLKHLRCRSCGAQFSRRVKARCFKPKTKVINPDW